MKTAIANRQSEHSIAVHAWARHNLKKYRQLITRWYEDGFEWGVATAKYTVDGWNKPPGY